MLSNVLSHEQYDVVTVTSSREALNQHHVEEWDLIITEVMMPHMSGYQLTKEVRKKFANWELPILHLITRNKLADIYTSFASGANDYVVKPVNALELKIKVNTLCSIKRSIHKHLYIEAAFLQAQIKPHFLFNTLNTIIALSQMDDQAEKTIDLLKHFGKYLYKSFDPQNIERIAPIDHELELVRSYLYVEKVRFDEKLQIKWDVDDHLALFVPPLSIQTLVENAVRHGLMSTIDGGILSIKVKRENDFVTISVSDNGGGMEQAQIDELLTSEMVKGKGIGIRNTQKRLLQLYGEGLQINSSLGKGTTVSFRVPLKEN